MRTTIAIDDDVYRDVKQFAESRSLSTCKAVSELLRRGLSMRAPTRSVNGLLVFDLPSDSPAVTTERVRELEAET